MVDEQEREEAPRPIVIELSESANTRPSRDLIGMPALLLASLSVVTTAVLLAVLLAGRDPEPLLGALFTALLTVATLVPAVIGLIVVERPSARLNHGRVLWAGPLLAITILVVVCVVLGLAATLTFLALETDQTVRENSLLGLIAVISGVSVLELLPFLIYVLIQRSSARDSTRIIRAQLHKLTRKDPHDDAGQRQALLKAIRDIAVIEFRANDRFAVRQRMQGLALISVQEEGQLAQAAVEELAFLGQHLILDRDLAVDSLALLNHVLEQEKTKHEVVATVLHEYFSFWNQARIADASPQVSKKAFDGIKVILSSTFRGGLVKTLALEVDEFMGEVPPSRLRPEDPGWLVAVIETARCSVPAQLLDTLEASRSPKSLDLLARLIVATPDTSRDKPIKAFQRLAISTTSGLPHHPVASRASSSIGILLQADPELAWRVCHEALTPPPSEAQSRDAAGGGLVVQLVHEAWDHDNVYVIGLIDEAISKANADDMSLLNGGLHWRLQDSLQDLRGRLFGSGDPTERDKALAKLYLSFYVQNWDLSWQVDERRLDRRTALRSLRSLLLDGLDLPGDEGAQVKDAVPGHTPGEEVETRGETSVQSDLLEVCCRKLAYRLERDEKRGLDSSDLLARTGEILDIFAAQRNRWSAARIAWLASLQRDDHAEKFTVPSEGDDRVRLFFDCAWLFSQGVTIFESVGVNRASDVRTKRSASTRRASASDALPKRSDVSDGVDGLRAVGRELTMEYRVASHQTVLKGFSSRKRIEAAGLTPQQCLDFLTWLSDQDANFLLAGAPAGSPEERASDFDPEQPDSNRAVSAARARLILLAQSEGAALAASGDERLAPSVEAAGVLSMKAFTAVTPALLRTLPKDSPSPEEAEAPWVTQTIDRVVERWILSLEGQSREFLDRHQGTIRQFASLLAVGAVPLGAVQRAAFLARRREASRACFGPIERLPGGDLLGVCVPLVRSESTAFEGVMLLNVLLESAPSDEDRDLRLDKFTEAIGRLMNAGLEPNGRLAMILARTIAKQPSSFSRVRQFPRLVGLLMDVESRLTGPSRSSFDASWNGLVNKFSRAQTWETATTHLVTIQREREEAYRMSSEMSTPSFYVSSV